VLPGSHVATGARKELQFDLVANAFYFLASCAERKVQSAAGSRTLYADSVFHRFGVPQDVVDRYLGILVHTLHALCVQLHFAPWPRAKWPGGHRFSVVLSHDIDFLPSGPMDVVVQGGKTFLRHLFREGAPIEAVRAMAGLAGAVVQGRDPYGCVPEIIEMERSRGVRSSFQVAVARRHPRDVNYDIRDERTTEYLSAIPRAGFDLCLHGSYRSSENPQWYRDEVALIERRLGEVQGSRQHFLSFDYDSLFGVQETTSVEFDMSMGYPDHIGPRAGFSYPYFPYCVAEDRPYDVLQISLLMMDVTLRSYMRLSATRAWNVIQEQLAALAESNGCGSIVWHPIVFGGARDPGYAQLYWRMIDAIKNMSGLATDGAEINAFWRVRATGYASFAKCRAPFQKPAV